MSLWQVFVIVSGIEKPSIVTKMNVTLSADHRIFDGQVGGNATFSSFYCYHSLCFFFVTYCFYETGFISASFLSELRSNFEDVRRLLLWEDSTVYQMNLGLLHNKPWTWTPRAHPEPELLVYRISSDYMFQFFYLVPTTKNWFWFTIRPTDWLLPEVFLFVQSPE